MLELGRLPDAPIVSKFTPGSLRAFQNGELSIPAGDAILLSTGKRGDYGIFNRGDWETFLAAPSAIGIL